MTTTRWGILATGRIARSFAANLREVPGAELVASGSRSRASAEVFAKECGGRAHASYEDLVTDPDIDIVYVASPHALHLDHARLAFAAGKHVLCEKPLAMDAAESAAMISAARAADRFLMEAMWMACHPTIVRLRDDLHSGRFGTPRQIHADLGFVVPPDPGSRMWDPSLGASTLLDMGIYPLTFAYLMLGPARRVTGRSVLDERSVDVDVAVVAEYDGALASLTASMTSQSSRTASIATDAGHIELAAPFHHPDKVIWHPIAGDPEPVVGDAPLLGTGLGNEALHVQECLAAGLSESPLVPFAQTLEIARQMGDLRAQFASGPDDAARPPSGGPRRGRRDGARRGGARPP